MKNRLIVKFSHNRELLDIELGTLDTSFRFIEEAISALGKLYTQNKIDLLQAEQGIMKILHSTHNLQRKKRGKFSLLFLANTFIPITLGNVSGEYSDHVYLSESNNRLKCSFNIKMHSEDISLSDFFMCASNAHDFLRYLLGINFINEEKFIELDYQIKNSLLFLSN